MSGSEMSSVMADSEYCAARQACVPCYRTVSEVIWEKQEYECCKTLHGSVSFHLKAEAT